MPNKYLLTVILPEFIRVLENYDISYSPIRAAITRDNLYRTKHAKAKILLGQLKKLAETGEISVFNEAAVAVDANMSMSMLELERVPSRMTNLTMPSRGTETSEWAATPLIRNMLFSQTVVTTSDEDWAPATPSITATDVISDETDSLPALISGVKTERYNIHKARDGWKTGSFDGILYAMSRSLCFVRWFYDEINIPVDSPNENIEDIEPNQRHCLQLIWLIATYMCKYAYDRACKNWDNHHTTKLKDNHYYLLEYKYYLNSGIFHFPKATQENMEKLDAAGNTMVNCLTILSDIYLADTNTQLKSFDFVTTSILDAKIMPIEYMNKDFLDKIKAIKNNLIVPATIETVVRPSLLEAVLFDSRNDEDITLEENKMNRLDTMSPSKMQRTHSTNSTNSTLKLDL